MDGLKISTAESLLKTGQTESQIQDSKFKNEIAGQKIDGSFAETLNEAVNHVNELQKVSNKKMEELATGQAKSIPDVMVAAEKADIALKLMVSVRNKMIEAYQEIMKMPV